MHWLKLMGHELEPARSLVWRHMEVYKQSLPHALSLTKRLENKESGEGVRNKLLKLCAEG
jgi:hypothetical protein